MSENLNIFIKGIGKTIWIVATYITSVMCKLTKYSRCNHCVSLLI